MAGTGSLRYDIIVLSKLMRNYVNYESASSRERLSNMILEGSDVIDALDNAVLDKEEYEEAYEELEEKYKELEEENDKLKEGSKDYQNLKKSLESLIKDKEGPFVEKIKNMVEEAKQS